MNTVKQPGQKFGPPCCGWCMSNKQHSLNLILLFLLVGSTWSRSSPSGHSGTSCQSWLPSPPCYKLIRFVLLVGLNLISASSYEEGVQAAVSLTTHALKECYDQQSMSMVWTTWQHALPLMQSPPCSLLAKMQFLTKSPPFSLLAMARVSGSDKLYNSSLIYRIKWIMVMTWWLTLPKCHSIQLNY